MRNKTQEVALPYGNMENINDKTKQETINYLKTMDNKLKECRRRINGYFGEVKHNLHIRRIKGNTVFDVEYEDFKNELHVEAAIREIIGDNYLLNIKRYCSEAMMETIRRHYGPAADRKTLHEEMAEYEE